MTDSARRSAVAESRPPANPEEGGQDLLPRFGHVDLALLVHQAALRAFGTDPGPGGKAEPRTPRLPAVPRRIDVAPPSLQRSDRASQPLVSITASMMARWAPARAAWMHRKRWLMFPRQSQAGRHVTAHRQRKDAEKEEGPQRQNQNAAAPYKLFGCKRRTRARRPARLTCFRGKLIALAPLIPARRRTGRHQDGPCHRFLAPGPREQKRRPDRLGHVRRTRPAVAPTPSLPRGTAHMEGRFFQIARPTPPRRMRRPAGDRGRSACRQRPGGRVQGIADRADPEALRRFALAAGQRAWEGQVAGPALERNAVEGESARNVFFHNLEARQRLHLDGAEITRLLPHAYSPRMQTDNVVTPSENGRDDQQFDECQSGRDRPGAQR